MTEDLRGCFEIKNVRELVPEYDNLNVIINRGALAVEYSSC